MPQPADILAAARTLGRELTPAQAEKLARYLGLLVKWNRAMNLVGKRDWRSIFDTLVVDSLYLADFLAGLGQERVSLDLGAGAGLPGIPLRILREVGEYWLVESREKRAVFLRQAVAELGLARATVFHGRAETLRETVPPADRIVSRAFMPWPRLLPFVRGMLASDGAVIVLSNDPSPPASAVPGGWSLAASAGYPAAGRERHFLAFTPESISR